MNSHRKEVINSSMILKLNQEQTKDSDEVTEAISKLQQNGVNCIVFTKNELLDLSNVKNGHHNRHTVVNVMQKTKEQQKLTDLLDYEPDIKSINSSLAIQLASNTNYHPSQNIVKRPKAKRRCKGKQKLLKQNSTGRIQKSNNFKQNKKSLRMRTNHKQEYNASPYNLRNQASSIRQLLSSSEIEKDFELNSDLSTPPPCLSPQCIQGMELEGFPISVISEIGFENEEMEIGNGCVLPLPLLSPPLPIPTFVETSQEQHHTSRDVLETMETLLSAIVREREGMTPEDGQCIQSVDLCHVEELNLLVQAKNPLEASTVDLTAHRNKNALQISKYETSFPLINEDSSMKLSHSSLDASFYSLVINNVRYNLENYLDGIIPLRLKKCGGVKKRKRYKNGYLLYHGDNYPDNPELSYKLNLTTQILLKLNRKRFYKPKTDKRKTLLAYFNLIPKRPIRKGRTSKIEEPTQPATQEEESIFSGEWTLNNKYVCGICKHEETYFWDMVTHKGEEHSGVLVTHVELPVNQEVPRTLIRDTAKMISQPTPENSLPPCTKCSSVFSSYPELHRHLFECSGNTDWLREQTVKKPTKARRRRRQGFKRRLSNNSPKKNGGLTLNSTKIESPSKRKSSMGSTTTIYKCKFCIRHFKTEGWLKNHLATHTLLVSIPLHKLPKHKISLPLSLPQTPQTRASNWSLRKCRAVAQ